MLVEQLFNLGADALYDGLEIVVFLLWLGCGSRPPAVSPLIAKEAGHET